jgi:hypothetical protein
MRSLGAMSDTFTIGGDLRLGFGAMRITRDGIAAAAELHLSVPEVDRLAAADRGRSPA